MVLGLDEPHLLAGIRSCTDGGLNFAVVFKTVQPVKAQHETGGGHLPADTHQLPHAHKSFTTSACWRHRYLECELHELRYETRVSLFSHEVKESQHKLMAGLVRQEVGACLRRTRTRRSDNTVETRTHTHHDLVGNAHVEDGQDVRHHPGFE